MTSMEMGGRSSKSEAWPKRLGMQVGAGHCLALLALVYSAAAFAISPNDFLPLARSYLTRFCFFVPALSLVLLVLAPLLDIRRPFTAMVERVRRAGFPMLAIVSLSILFLAAFTVFKINIPRAVPFYADPALATLDEWLHGGSPWLYLHAIDPDWFAPAMQILYGKIWFAQWFVVALFAAFNWHDRRHQRYLWTPR